MKILKGNFFHKDSINVEDEKFLSDILKRVVLVCREDESFNKSGNTEKLEKIENKLYSKDKKLDNLLERSNLLRKDLREKISYIESVNSKVRTTLLESLGS